MCSSSSGVHRPPNVEGEIVWQSFAHLLYNQRNTNKIKLTHTQHTRDEPLPPYPERLCPLSLHG